jgi:Ham1 family protein
MAKKIAFITGNPHKLEEAKSVLKNYEIVVESLQFDIEEIQHYNPLEITKSKVRAAYEKAGQSVVVNDSSWEIPALGGFPGGYMKDVVNWFTAEDFLALMKDKNDRRIILHDVVAYFDGEQLELFIYDQTGVFINEPRGEGTSMNQVVSMENSGGLTIAEEFALRHDGVEINPSHFQHWQKFGEWFTARDDL